LNFPYQQGSHYQISTFCIFESPQPILVFFGIPASFSRSYYFWDFYPNIFFDIYCFFIFTGTKKWVTTEKK